MPPSASFQGRRPPVSIESEQAVLGSVLLDNRAYQKAADIIAEEHFAEQVHRQIWHVLAGIIEKGDLATPMTAKTYLGDADLGGGQTVGQYLARLSVGGVPVNQVADHAKIVRSLAARREIIAMTERVAGVAYDCPVEETAETIFANVERLIEETRPAVTKEQSDFEDFGGISSQDVFDAYKRGAGVVGLSTGLPALDAGMGGLRKSDLIILAGRPAMGKAQPLDAQIKTLDGWTEMGRIRVGDRLASHDGQPSEVTAIYPQGVREVFEIAFSDGRRTKACAEHLWRVMYRDWDAPRVLDTARLKVMLSRKRYQGRLSVDMVSGDFGRDEYMPLDPWLLGLILGNGRLSGSIRLTTRDEENLARVERFLPTGMELTRNADGQHCLRQSGPWRVAGHQGSRPNPYAAFLNGCGLGDQGCHTMFVPSSYLAASRGNRMALLQGLMDANGYVERNGAVRFVTTSAQLAHDVENLVRSLGGLCWIKQKQPTYRYKGERLKGRLAYICCIRHSDASVMFCNERKRSAATRTRNTSVRLNVTSVTSVGQAETQCIRVSHPDHLYITDDYVVTHNTALTTNIAVAVAKFVAEQHAAGVRMGPVAFSSLEMGKRQLKQRILADQSRVPFWKLDRGIADKAEMERYVLAERAFDKLPLLIDDTGGLTIGQLKLRARTLKRRRGISLLVIDYLQLLSGSGRKDANRVAEVTEITTGLKALAKELDIPIIALSQLSRKVEDREDKRPQLGDLRESGSIEQDADVVLFVYREDYYLKKSEPRVDGTEQKREAHARWESLMKRWAGCAEVIIGKNRHGSEGTVDLGFDAQFTRFTNEPEPREIEPEEVRQRAAKKPTFTAEGTILYGILKSLTLTRSTMVTQEQRDLDRRLCKGARLVPLDTARKAFGEQVCPGETDQVVNTRFRAAFVSLRKAEIAFYQGVEETGYSVWLPELVAEV